MKQANFRDDIQTHRIPSKNIICLYLPDEKSQRW